MPRELSLGLEKASSPPDMMLIISAGLLIERVLKAILPTVEKKERSGHKLAEPHVFLQRVVSRYLFC